jgi:iron complex transport system ATP-binding protein
MDLGENDMDIRVKDLSVHIGKKNIIKDINVAVDNGEFVGIVGPNGSGKSTLLKSIYRMLKPSAGIIELDNILIEKLPIKETAKNLGVMTQSSSYSFDFTVEEIVMMGRTPHKKLMEPDNDEDYEIAYESLNRVGMEDFAERKFNTLSGGEKQRVLIARALTGQPKALILDEPTNHLDIHYQISLLEIVKSLKIEIFTAMHDLNLAAYYCSKIYVMKNGRIVRSGNPKEVFTIDTLREVFDVNAAISEDKTGRLNIVYTGI